MAPPLAPVSREPLTKSDAQLVAEACGSAAQILGLSREDLSAVVGKHRTSIDRSGLDPNTKEAELALVWAVSEPPSSEAKLPSVDDSCFPGMTWCGDRFPCCPGSRRSCRGLLAVRR